LLCTLSAGAFRFEASSPRIGVNSVSVLNLKLSEDDLSTTTTW
jgi:hypothetical protein